MVADVSKLAQSICGVDIDNERCGIKLEIDFNRLTFDSALAKEYMKLLDAVVAEDVVINNLLLVQLIIQLGNICCNMKLIDDEYWYVIFDVKYSSSMKVSADCCTLKYLLSNGLNFSPDDNNNWKFLEVLLKIMNGVQRTKSIITNLIKKEFPFKLGILLDNITDFQQANYIIEILSFCFPRKSIDKPGVVLPPQPWEDTIKCELFFNRNTYPFKGKHGDQQVLKFVWELFAKLLIDIQHVSNVSYGLESDNRKAPARSLVSSEKGNNFFIQCYSDKMYLWIGEGQFLEIKRNNIEITNDLKGRLKLKIIDGKCKNTIRSPNKTWLSTIKKVSWFIIDFSTQTAGVQYFKKITNKPKISEVQQFLTLSHIEEEEEENISQEGQHEISSREATVHLGKQNNVNSESLSVLLSQSFSPLTQVSGQKTQFENSMLATPDKSDLKSDNDIWDLNISSDGKEKKKKGNTSKITTSKSKIKPPSIQNVLEEEESPIVQVQQNKLRRTLSKAKQELIEVRDDSLHSNPNQLDAAGNNLRTDSILITGSNIIKDKRDKKVNKKLTQLLIKSGSDKDKKSKYFQKKSVGKQDLKVLDTIFAKPVSKKLRSQQKLKNIINVGKKTEITLMYNKLDNKDTKEVERCDDTNKKNDIRTPNKIATENDTSGNMKRKFYEQESTEDTIGTAAPISKRVRKPQENREKLEPLQQKAKRSLSNKINKSIEPIPSGQEQSLDEKDKSEKVGHQNNQEKSIRVDISDSTTIVAPVSMQNSASFGIDNLFTIKLQEQITQSISKFSEELRNKIIIINSELNNKIMKELSEKYQKVFHDLQVSFKNDTEEMFEFVGEIKNMLNLPEEELVQVIRNRKFGSN
ncbi:hypothetical protein Kpol_1037p39 [Vanderwaltozyma polyspora DSM 70294]|uniref:Uncharacterized protein n=1 Tax=Vanderwaltozyma polyspora (strain ATCC 22028 / DSM 70294 / BCRC 21397 / CBS 2163 / NBRC 10782 / NRRL Y-8283 / UCD 57-17) TaxID=436907 RepID=A7TJY0_VANPO|nr:uncharacterized protein Kpol_1037p39 [Vanderwaltozyma polyspora DSM 70294]EDO17442.1 hypothetical protein Kpol_1037p39 [Vanderwaltozyma polyspora DSM 70294]